MRSVLDETLVEERRRFSLRLHCEDCAHWDDEGEVCVHGYPTDEHRKRPEASREPLVFCKEFDLA